MQNGFTRHTKGVQVFKAVSEQYIFMYGNLCNVCVVPRWRAISLELGAKIGWRPMRDHAKYRQP
eukprot:5728665-Pleurochrysis_carterae.AAC.1